MRRRAGDLGQSLVWREMLADYGVVDAASLVLADQLRLLGVP